MVIKLLKIKTIERATLIPKTISSNIVNALTYLFTLSFKPFKPT